MTSITGAKFPFGSFISSIISLSVFGVFLGASIVGVTISSDEDGT